MHTYFITISCLCNEEIWQTQVYIAKSKGVTKINDFVIYVLQMLWYSSLLWHSVIIYSSFFFINWNTIDLQCHLSFRCIASDSIIHTHISIILLIIFLYWLLQNIEYSSLCYTLGPHWLSILDIVVCIN